MYNYQNNNNIMRYQNLYNNGTLSSENKINFSSNDNINLNQSYKRTIKYKPYTLVDYKKKYENNYIRSSLGGLGANIGGEEWVDRQKKLERKKEYSEYVKSDNEEDFKKMNKLKIKIKTDNNYEITKTISSKKSSNYSYNGKRIKTENNIRKGKPSIKLPLINQKVKNNINQYKIKDNYEYEMLNPVNSVNGNEKDLKELIKKYEEYNGEFKL